MGLNARVAMVHVVPFLAEAFQAAALRIGGPSADVVHLVEPALFAPGEINADSLKASALVLAERAATLAGLGAEAMLVTCSALGDAIDAAARVAPIPVLRIDRPLAAEAVKIGSRIAVLSTHPEGLAETAQVVREAAVAAGRDVTIQTHSCDGAFDKLAAGDKAGHDDEVARSIAALQETNDIVIMAQPSMARVVDQLPEARRTAVLTSIEPAARALLASASTPAH